MYYEDRRLSKQDDTHSVVLISDTIHVSLLPLIEMPRDARQEDVILLPALYMR
ncbi:uncharacterized protein TRIREDRAFT_109030 [Trichoderma reesei QM6a]|uniref:Predicted protein n=2 Tax=Hypocrea jecorina TaxID=51453 RepID=G0RNN6_HYPJQ